MADRPLDVADRPLVLLVVGVNGVGKTTGIAKLTNLYLQDGQQVVIGAADTFRAGAAEQLRTWGRRLDVDVISHREGADPGAVAFDTVSAAMSRDADVVIVDTAGRLHTKTNLMEELKKIRRESLARHVPDSSIRVLSPSTPSPARTDSIRRAPSPRPSNATASSSPSLTVLPRAASSSPSPRNLASPSSTSAPASSPTTSPPLTPNNSSTPSSRPPPPTARVA